ncbi:MAG: hypothetical protein GX442_19415 [Candidatus Riflebacteria bacterium]|nr:hypothetical protein [Candidatus Riflebacteria bacterium]
MNRHGSLPVMIVVVLLLGLPGVAGAGQDTGKFDFYYQKIEKVIPLEPAKKPEGLWENAKALAQKGWNFVRKYSEVAFRRNVAPGEGKKTWYGSDNSTAYEVRRTKVRDEAHLLSLMGVTNGDLSKLTNGQRALLEIYRNAANPTMKSLSDHSLAPRIIVHLSDTTGFNDAQKYPKVEDDFWPMSMGLSITMPSGRYEYSGSDKGAVRTFVHETAHCTNLTLQNYKGYGPDGHHSRNELTKPRSAFQEAWSEYQELLFDPDLANSWKTSYQSVRIEDAKKAGVYESVPFTDSRITGKNLFSIEALDAWVLYRLATEIPDGRAKVEKAFFKQNVPWSSMAHFLKAYAKMYPQHAGALRGILAEVGAGKLSDQDLTALTGVAAAPVAPSTAAAPAAAQAATEPSPASLAPSRSIAAPARKAVAASLETLQKRYEEAYLAYVKAVQRQEPNLARLKQTLLDAKAALEALRR